MCRQRSSDTNLSTNYDVWYLEDARNSRIRINKRAACLEDRRRGRVQLVVGVQKEEHVERFLEDGVGPVVLLAEVVHLVQEPEGRKDGFSIVFNVRMYGELGTYDPV